MASEDEFATAFKFIKDVLIALLSTSALLLTLVLGFISSNIPTAAKDEVLEASSLLVWSALFDVGCLVLASGWVAADIGKKPMSKTVAKRSLAKDERSPVQIRSGPPIDAAATR